MQRMLDSDDRAGALRQFDLLTRALDDELGIGPSAERTAGLGRRLVGAVDATRRQPALDEPRHPGGAPPLHARRRSTRLRDQRQRTAAREGVELVDGIDYDWSSPVWRHWWQALSQHHTLVRYDERGCGLSDWDVDDDSYTLGA